MKKHLSLIALALVLQGCPGQEKDDPQVALPKEYESCCGVQPVDFKLSGGSIYVPNVFTPNGDGLNDLFYPFISQEIGEAQGFTIFDATGDTVIFQRPTVAYDRLNEFAWNGKRTDGSTYRGKFKYGMRVVSKDLVMRFVEGEACSVLCEPGTKELKTKKSCFYPSQAGKNEKAGKVDETLPNNETGCLK
jgi:hypothetical protein